MDIEKTLKQMTLQEKAALVSGTDFTFTNPIPRLGIPSLYMTDGPHGVRMQKPDLETGKSNGPLHESGNPATVFPAAAATACSWNPELLREMGEAIGEECRYYGVHTLLGPGVNIKRNPLCGRSFEYFSEDPCLAGVLGAALVEGLQSRGVGACIKHFAMNNSENYRFMGNSVASENTIRNIYLKPFEYIVKNAHPAAVMCAYNQINGVYCSENRWLLTDVLRREWGFDGVVMSDWGAVRDRVSGIKAGLDLEMPGDTAICRRSILDAAEKGTLPVKDLDLACRNILKWIDKYVKQRDETPVNWKKHHELAGQIAADSAVLMKNDGTLPLDPSEKLHLTGPMYEKTRYQGAGSSMVAPRFLTTVKDEFDRRNIRNHTLEECDTILVFAGITDDYESEGSDRKDMKLPDDQIRLIDELCTKGRKVVVVLFGGSAVELPFNDKVNSILNMHLPGQNAGSAAAQLLFGEVNPSGKLAQTWPLRYEDVPGSDTFGKTVNEVYTEGCDVGYRYYQKHNIKVQYPFGHGLSYTTFEQSEWRRHNNTFSKTITNTGSRSGAEVAMLYINGELKGFRKVRLEPGETAEVVIDIEDEAKAEYDDTIPMPETASVSAITMESRFTELNRTFTGKLIYRAVMSLPHAMMKKAMKMPEGPEKDNAVKNARFLEKTLESGSLRSMSMSAGKKFPYNVARGLMETANGHILKGLKCFMTPIKVPPLPAETERRNG